MLVSGSIVQIILVVRVLSKFVSSCRSQQKTHTCPTASPNHPLLLHLQARAWAATPIKLMGLILLYSALCNSIHTYIVTVRNIRESRTNTDHYLLILVLESSYCGLLYTLLTQPIGSWLQNKNSLPALNSWDYKIYCFLCILSQPPSAGEHNLISFLSLTPVW